jgi:uncharacterized membrane protein ArfC
MQNANWWLMALAFLLGLVLTLALTIRRVKGEVPASATLAAGAAKLTGSAAGDAEADDDAATLKAPAVAAIADVPAGPHGPGSAKPGERGSGPSGWAVKGNEDSKLYHTPASPSYKRTIAEVWFFDEATAQAAGFNRWDSGKSQRGKG